MPRPRAVLSRRFRAATVAAVCALVTTGIVAVSGPAAVAAPAAPPVVAVAHAAPGGGPWNSVTGGDEHTCGVRADHTLWCWGDNEAGGLGVGDLVDRVVPTQVGTDANWASVSAGFFHTCGTRTDHSLWCWGGNLFGQLDE